MIQAVLTRLVFLMKIFQGAVEFIESTRKEVLQIRDDGAPPLES
jgi:hypothetical protein